MVIVEVPNEVVTSVSILDCEPRTVHSCQVEFMMRVAQDGNYTNALKQIE